ncbi:MAG: metallophosphoesterase [Betaproteobacteria bacterium]|nr:metallophosphoesterase [Betaproteobacteria bacterium]
MRPYVLKVMVCFGLLGSAQQAIAGSGISSYVGLGPQGQAIARVVTRATECPALNIDGHQVPMITRAEPRETPLSPEHPAIFSVRVCELVLPSAGLQVLLDGKKLPEVKGVPRKIVLLGDTGCRLKWPAAYQPCNDPEAWPLARVALSAAAEKPDLVIHVGDYHYRESRCLSEGCAHSPHGYGSDTWEADFFEPMRPLLQAAPWVFTRGNHESCARAGQGWFRFFDPHAYDPKHSCDEATPTEADFTPPYAVPLGPQQQLIVFDSSAAAPEKIPGPGTAAVTAYAAQFEQVAALARNRRHNWLVLHHPVLGYDYLPLVGYQKGNPTLLAALQGKHYPAFFPEGIQLTLQGHIHTFELDSFQGREPMTLITGFGGSLLEPEFPKWLPNLFQLAPGVTLAETHATQQFGYTVLEQRDGRWTLLEKDTGGHTRLHCTLQLEQAPYEFDCSN